MDTMKVKETAEKYLYTYKDYAAIDDDNRYELIDGVLYLMSAPSYMHQKISGSLFNQLYNFLKGKPCEVLHPPFDVCMFGLGDEDKNVFQPDLLVICDKSKLSDGKRCNGAPDMVIEIISPSSVNRDTLVKFNKYLQAGVREYWVIDPDDKKAHVHILDDDKYITKVYGEDDAVAVHGLNGCVIEMREVFA